MVEGVSSCSLDPLRAPPKHGFSDETRVVPREHYEFQVVRVHWQVAWILHIFLLLSNQERPLLDVVHQIFLQRECALCLYKELRMRSKLRVHLADKPINLSLLILGHLLEALQLVSLAGVRLDGVIVALDWLLVHW